jgi:hypothetical protein
MDKFVVTSMRPSAGKTSLIIGLARAMNKKMGYLKPLGTRLLYKKKRLWDYDAALMTSIFNPEEHPEDMSIGFHHSKLRYTLDEKSTEAKILEAMNSVGDSKDLVFVEAGRDIFHGASVCLDALSVTRIVAGQLLIMLSGDEDTIVDDIRFLKNYIRLESFHFMGVVINKVVNVNNFIDVYLPMIRKMDVPVLGVIPSFPELTYFSVQYLADRMFAKILAGESGLNRQIRNIGVGAVGGDSAMKNPLLQDHHQVVIASGDRSDLILMSLENNVAAILLPNNIVPSPVILARAETLGIPLLLVSTDIHKTARQIEGIEPLPTQDDMEKINLFEKMVRDHVDLTAFEKEAQR